MKISDGEFRKSETPGQCALTGFVSFAPPTPCHMEALGEHPEWEECFYRDLPNLPKSVRVYARKKSQATVPA